MKVADYLENDLWLAGPPGSRIKRAAVVLLRVLLLSAYGFKRHECSSRAAALTFYSLFSIVPLFALALGIAKGFQWDEFLRQQAARALAVNREIVPFLLSFAERILQVSGGLMGLVGFIALVWTALSAMSSIESALDAIHSVARGRTVPRMVADYLAFILFAVAMVALSGELTVLTHRVFATGAAPAAVLLGAGNFLVLVVLFSAIYFYVPNEPIPPWAAIAGGVTAAVLYLAAQWVFIRFQIGVSKYNAIYGGLAALPLFLIWLRFSWMLLLFGAEISAAVMNRETRGYSPAGIYSPCVRRADLLRAMHGFAAEQAQGTVSCSVRETADRLQMPFQTAKNALRTLERAGLIAEALHAEEPSKRCFRVEETCEALTVPRLMDAVEREEARRVCVRSRAEALEQGGEQDGLVRLVRDALPDRAVKDV